jgi:hypothetical protein
VLFGGCVTVEGPSGQGGAQFKQVDERPALEAEALFPVCWPADAAPNQRVSLVTLASGDVMFEASEGASNSTARCLREIAASYPDRKLGELQVAPPARRASGWAVLGYVQLLSSRRFGPERGLLDPAPLVRACLSKGEALRAGTRFQISNDPSLKVTLESSDGFPIAPITGAERCVEAVLGSTAWPGTRPFTLEFEAAGDGRGEVDLYFAMDAAKGGLDPALVKEAMSTRGPAVGACWEEALARRAGLSGGRSIRMRIDEAGTVTQASIVGNVSAEPTTAADYLLDVCLAHAAKLAHFPSGAPGDAVYSWVFAQRG